MKDRPTHAFSILRGDLRPGKASKTTSKSRQSSGETIRHIEKLFIWSDRARHGAFFGVKINFLAFIMKELLTFQSSKTKISRYFFGFLTFKTLSLSRSGNCLICAERARRAAYFGINFSFLPLIMKKLLKGKVVNSTYPKDTTIDQKCVFHKINIFA